MRRLDPNEFALLVIDIQERLVAAMPATQMSEVTRSAAILIEAASIFGAPILATEQYPQGLGRTIGPVAERLDAAGAARIEKIDFSACDCADFERSFAKTKARAVVVIGMETHVCVFQTVRELAARGLHVLVPLDGVASRRAPRRRSRSCAPTACRWCSPT
jgi:nicotinamidase-related amidase